MKKLGAIIVGAAFVLSLGCGEEIVAPPGETTSNAAVFRSLVIGREDPKGVAPGFDLDGYTSNVSDERGCRIDDFMSPDGREGVDNQFAVLMPLLDVAAEGALDAFIQDAISEGRLLIIPELETHPDGTMDLTLWRGEDTPLLGADGELLEGQTLSLHEAPLLGRFEGAEMDENGVVSAGPFDLRLLIIVFNLLYVVDLHDAQIEFRLMENGRLDSGMVGGSVTVEQLLEIAAQAAERANLDFIEILNGSIDQFADTARDAEGKCHSLSVGASFDAVPAFIFD